MPRRYGWKPPRPEAIAAAPKYRHCPRLAANLPPSVDLRAKFPPVYDQGDLGSCTANMSAAMVQYDQAIQGLPLVMPSRLFDYYDSRLLEGTTSQDAGASIADAVKALDQYGWCPESQWPYDTSKYATKPPQSCYDAAKANEISDYFNVAQDATVLKTALAQGEPVGIGFVVYESFESQAVAQSGVMPMPSAADKRQGPIGGHAVVVVGYDDSRQAWIVRNSWGEEWGIRGYFLMPYAYLLEPNLASDFWVIRTIPGSVPTPPSPPAPPAPAGPTQQQVLATIDEAFKVAGQHQPLLQWLGLPAVNAQVDTAVKGLYSA